MTKDEFERLDEKSKRLAAQKALAWFCVLTTMRLPYSYLDMIGKEESETIKIILGKYIDEEMDCINEQLYNLSQKKIIKLTDISCDSEKEG